MRPLYLSIEGINSFFDKQEIDFELLTENNIFCIYGPTGSGKTTVLDSIILALYGSGDRVETLAEYVNLGKKSAEIVFRFLLGDTTYEVNKTFKKKTGADKAFLYNLSEGGILICDGVNNVNNKLSEILGISRNEFTQIVILEQGKFSKFLAAKRVERNLTISQLFQLSKYDALHKKCNENIKKINDKIENVDSKMMHLRGVSNEILECKKLEFNDLSIAIKELTKNIETTDNLILSSSANRADFITLNNARESLESASSSLKGLNDDELVLRRDEAAFYSSEKAYLDAKNTFLECDKILTKLESIKDDAVVMDEREKQRGELLKLYKEKEKTLNDILLERSDLKVKKDNFMSQSASIISDIELITFTEFSIESGSILQEITSSKLELLKAQSDITAERKNIDAFSEELQVTQTLIKTELSLEDCKKIELKELNEKLIKAEEERDRLEKSLLKVQRENMAAHIARDLKKGDACPVCGGEFTKAHTLPCDNENKIQIEFQLCKTTCDSINSLVKNLSNEILSITLKIKSLNESELKLKGKLELNEKEISKILSKLKFNISEDKVGVLIELFEKMEQTLLKLAEVEKQEAGGNAKQIVAQNELDKIIEKGVVLKQQIDDFKLKVLKEVGEDYLKIERETIERKTDCKKIIESHELKKQQLVDKRAQLALGKAKFSQQKLQSDTEILRLRNVTFDAETHKSLEVKKQELNLENNIVVSRHAKLQEEIIIMEKNLAEKIILQKEKDALSKKCDTVEALAKMFYGNKFLEYIELEYILEFTEKASDVLFNLSGGKYRLSYLEENKNSDFWVTDFLRGNDKRKIRTLSGGETFLASMAMAIAISKQVAKERSFDFFFLDEGFGTLDENAIEIVTDALYNLSKETLVGLVSHRSEIVERIPSRVEISAPTDSVGSKIIIRVM